MVVADRSKYSGAAAQVRVLISGGTDCGALRRGLGDASV